MLPTPALTTKTQGLWRVEAGEARNQNISPNTGKPKTQLRTKETKETLTPNTPGHFEVS